ncbi:hypothetical protein ACOMHN_034124 [Nucella lapillus]
MECQRRSQEMKVKCQQSLAKEHDPVNRFRSRILKTGFSGLKNIARKFRVGDRNDDRRISLEEFKWICGTLGISMPEKEYSELFCRFDKDGNGYMDYEEFLFAVRPEMNENRKKLVKKAFAKMDKTGDERITVEDLMKTYNVTYHPKYQNGEMSKKDVIAEFLKSFDVDENCKDTKDDEDPVITMEEWMDYFAGVSVSIDNDVYFSLMMTNAWKLDEK